MATDVGALAAPFLDKSLLIGLAIIFSLILGVGIYIVVNKIQTHRKFSRYKVLIFTKDALNRDDFVWDTAGVYEDKDTKNKRFFLRRLKSSLNADMIPYITMPNKKKTKLVMLMQIGQKNFRFLKPTMGKVNLHFAVGEEDVNWALQDYEKQKGKWKFSWLKENLQLILMATTILLVFILMLVTLKENGKMITGFNDAASQFAEVAKQLAQAGCNQGSAVIQ